MSSSSDADDFNQDDIDDDSDSDSSDCESKTHGAAIGTARGFLTQLQEDLRGAPFNAELHVALIGALRESADLDRLRAARQQAAARVALPEALWLEWLQDEANLAGEGDFGDLEELHKAACAACPTSRIWLARCQLHRERQRAQDVPTVRAIYEEALSVLGLHPTEAPEVWADYRSFEETLLAAASAPSDRIQCAQRVRALFMRQLALPLPGVARLREAHATFEGSLDSAASSKTALAKAEALAISALHSWQQREALEQRLFAASRPAVTVGLIGSAGEEAESPDQVSAEILVFEETSGDLARIFVGHLRATLCAPHDPLRWKRFADFTAHRLKDPQKTVEVLERGVRHCTHSGDLWLELHMGHEGSGSPLSGLRGILERGIAALAAAPEHGSRVDAAIQELLLQHADAVRRALPPSTKPKDLWTEMRATFERALNMAQAPGADGSFCCQALLRWMRLEAYVVRDAQETLKVGHRLMKLWGGYYNVWSAFIAAMLYCLGSDSYATVRDLYMHAMAQVVDYPEQLCTDYVQFEREFGTFKSWRQASLSASVQYPAKRTTDAAEASEAPPEIAEPKKIATVGNSEPANAPVAIPGPTQHQSASATPDKEQPPRQAAAARKRAGAKAMQVSPKKRPRNTAAVTTSLNATSKPARHAPNAGSLGSVPHQAQASRDTQIVAVPLGENQQGSLAVDGERAAADTAALSPSKPAALSPWAAKASVAPAPTSSATHTEAEDKAGLVSSPHEKVQDATLSVAVASGTPSTESATPRTCSATEIDAMQVSDPQLQLAARCPAVGVTPEDASTLGQASSENTASPDSSRHGSRTDASGDAKVGLPPDDEDSGHGDNNAQNGHTEAKKKAHAGSHYHQKRMAYEAITPAVLGSEGEHTIYVSNLDWSVDEAQLHRLFSAVDGLKDVRLVRDFLKRSKGYAYIDFETSENVAVAVEKLNGVLVNNRPMRVARSLPTKPLFEERTIFLRNISAKATEADVQDAFASVGEVVGVRLPIGADTKVHKGYAYVEFSTAEAVEAALAKNGTELMGERLEVSRSIPMKDHRHQTAGMRKDMPQRVNQRMLLESRLQREDPVHQSAMFPTTVYVKNLAFQVDENLLKGHFSKCGVVSQVLIVRNAQGRSRGFGFVEFDHAEGAQAALLLTDSELCSREIVVSRSQRAITQKKAPPGQVAGAAGKAPPAVARPPAEVMGPPAAEVAHAPAPRVRLTAAATEANSEATAVHRPFRAARQEPTVQEVAGAGKIAAGLPAKGRAVGKGGAAARPMTNADFRALVAGESQ